MNFVMIIEQSDLNRGASNQFEHSSWQSMSWLLIIISPICDVWKPLFVWSWSKMVWYIHISIIIHNKFLLLLEQFHLEKKVIDIVQTMTWCQSFSLTIYLLIISRKKWSLVSQLRLLLLKIDCQNWTEKN